jgi:hypothetical protein
VVVAGAGANAAADATAGRVRFLSSTRHRSVGASAALKTPSSGCTLEICAPVAQLDRAAASGAVGREFESLRARHFPSLTIFSIPSELSSDCPRRGPPTLRSVVFKPGARLSHVTGSARQEESYPDFTPRRSVSALVPSCRLFIVSIIVLTTFSSPMEVLIIMW